MSTNQRGVQFDHRFGNRGPCIGFVTLLMLESFVQGRSGFMYSRFRVETESMSRGCAEMGVERYELVNE